MARIIALLFLSTLCTACVLHDTSTELHAPVSYVDPLIGTGASTTISALRHSEADNEPRGQTFPAVGFPFGMTQWTPQTQHTEQKCYSPFYSASDSLNGFRGSHWMSGSCTQDYGSMTIMPLNGELRLHPLDRATPFDRTSQITHPYAYSVYLPEEQIMVALSATERSGIVEVTFNNGGDNYILIEPNSDEGVGFLQIDPDKREISGYNPAHRIYQGWGEYAGFNGYFVAQFNVPFSDYGTWSNYVSHPENRIVTGDSTTVGGYVQFDIPAGDKVHVRIGTSFTSIDAARNNLLAEIPEWDIEAVKKASKAAWNHALSAIEVTEHNNGSDDALVQFYTAHYHASMLPRIFSDVSGTYPGFAQDSSTHTADDFTYYADYSVWDTYRAVHPLLTITNPTVSRDMIVSLIHKAEQGGWLPIFPAWNNYTAAMIGDHVSSIIADAYAKGITDFDAEKAYAYMHKNATDVPGYTEYVDGKGRRALLPYLEYGFMPLEEPITEAFHQQEQVSRTLEYAYDDFTVGVMAALLGHNDDAKTFFERASYYKNIIDPETGISRGRYQDGSWYTPFDPSERTYEFITEGSPLHYTWYVPHDVDGLIALMGGRKEFIKRLDSLFDEGEYWHGNEPGHQIAYLYVYAGAPWKTQQRIRDILKEEYSSGPGGLSGNDDAGQISAWYIFSALGMYPVSPGMPYYVIGTPSFAESKIRLDNGGHFTIRAAGVSEDNKYIQSARLNGAPLERAWIRHSEIIPGGLLEFEMGPQPDTLWASGESEAPPSLSRGLNNAFTHPVAF